jgi:hypothetical protein
MKNLVAPGLIINSWKYSLFLPFEREQQLICERSVSSVWRDEVINDLKKLKQEVSANSTK